MTHFPRTIDRFRPAFALAALAAALLAASASSPALGQGTRLWTQSQLEEFERGTPLGVAVTSDGHLLAGPGLSEVLTAPSTFVWSVAVDKAGTAYLGTASPATVLRVGADGKAFTLFESKEVSVQAVKLGPDGALYAATLPSGKVYKLKADATAKQDESSAVTVFDAALFDGGKAGEGKTAANSGENKKAEGGKAQDKPEGLRPEAKTHYIWDLSFDAAGRLYVAAGGPAAVYRVDLAAKSQETELFFKSDEAHIRCLGWDGKGNLIAGSDGSGLVYRIDARGKGYVLFEAPRREITAVAMGANGTIYAASVGDKSRNPLPPLAVQGNGAVTVNVVQPGSLQAANSSASLPEGSEIYALVEGQAPRKLWSGTDEIVYALSARPEGLLALSGNRGRIFRIAEDGSYADVAHLEAQQGLSLAVAEKGLFIGTGNTGKLVRLGAAEKHEYASDVLDAGALARFGRVEVEPGSSGYELLTRSGNVEQPVRGWSEWEPLKDGAVASPAGRFLQWKAVLQAGATVGAMGVNYLPVNAAPVVDEVAVVPGARVNAQGQPGSQPQTVSIAFNAPGQNAGMQMDNSANVPLQAIRDRTAIAVRWAAHDDNGDELTYSLYLRGDGESVWRSLKDKIAEKAYSFDAALIPDGGYRIKVVASDAPSHNPGEALSGEKVSERFEVDTTPPAVNGLKADAAGRVVFDAEDASSPIARAEYSLDAGPWQYIEPVGGISDSKREHYDLRLPAAGLAEKAGEHLLTVRVYDRHENVGVAKTVFVTPAK